MDIRMSMMNKMDLVSMVDMRDDITVDLKKATNRNMAIMTNIFVEDVMAESTRTITNV